MLALLVGVGVAFAANLTGSSFEIDENANLKVDGTEGAGSIDWASVTETRKTDLASGQNDNSFGNGTKEDTAVPSVVSGQIPNNKSDLLNFGAYLETNANGRFLNVFWHRVQEPSGTTNMDFEFNQSSTISANGVTPVRSAGDVLIQYDLAQGGTNPQLFISRWVTSGASSQCEAANSTPCWGTKQNLSAAGDATGSINTSAIPAGESDGLGPISARTFGEAQIDFDALAGGPGSCVSFGSAYLKSRSSDSFTAALKDFIAPAPTNIGNCAKVTIRKETTPEEDPNATTFGFSKTFPTDPTSANTFTLQDDGVKSYTNVLQGTNYVVDEDVIPEGWDLQNIDCSVAGRPSSGVTPAIDVAAGTVTFSIDSPSDVLDCTYTNRARGTIIVEKVTNGGTDTFEFTSNSLSPSPFNLTTTAEGNAGKDSEAFNDLAPGTYDVAESNKAGWDPTSATCSDGSNPSNIGLSANETVTCTFTNTKLGKIVVDKVTDPSGDPQSFDFSLTGGPSDPTDNFSLTDAATPHESAPLLPGSGYSVTETVPNGWDLTSASCDNGETNANNITVDAGQTVTCTFNNTLNRGKIVVDKVTDPSGDPQSFDFSLTGGPSNPTDNFSLTDAAAPHESDPLLPGSGYDVTETVPNGWDLTSASCDNGEINVNNITVDPGQTVTCTFNNAKKTTAISTSQSFTPQDTATIGGSGSGAFNGQVDFELYKGEDCSGTPVYFERNVSLPASGTLKTTNGAAANADHSAEYTISGDGSGEHHWKVSYHDDTNGHPNETSCVEESTVTIDNDNTTP